MKRKGTSVAKPRLDKPFSLRVPLRLLELLRRRAEESGRSVGGEILFMLDRHLWCEEKERREERRRREIKFAEIPGTTVHPEEEIAKLETELYRSHQTIVRLMESLEIERMKAATSAVNRVFGRLTPLVEDLHRSNEGLRKTIGKSGSEKQKLMRVVREQAQMIQQLRGMKKDAREATSSSETPAPQV